MSITHEQNSYPIIPAKAVTEDLPFEKALEYLRRGLKLYRKGWDNTNLEYIVKTETDIVVQKNSWKELSHFDFENEDLLTEDWCLFKK